jgi:hypothetical protein
MKENVQEEPKRDIIKDIEELLTTANIENTAYATALNSALIQILVDKGMLTEEDNEQFTAYYEDFLQQLLEEEDIDNDQQED